MSMQIMASKTQQGVLMPLTEYDAEVLNSLPMGKAYKLVIKQQSERSLQHHKLFFGGLLPLAFEYWQPSAGMVGKNEREVTHWVVERIAKASGADVVALKDYADRALDQLANKRAKRYGRSQTDIEPFRKWLIVEAGYFDVVETPNCIRKEAKSISFAKMGQEEFNAFYQACFEVAWNMMLRHSFDTPEQAQQAMEQLVEMGR